MTREMDVFYSLQ